MSSAGRFHFLQPLPGKRQVMLAWLRRNGITPGATFEGGYVRVLLTEESVRKIESEQVGHLFVDHGLDQDGWSDPQAIRVHEFVEWEASSGFVMRGVVANLLDDVAWVTVVFMGRPRVQCVAVSRLRKVVVDPWPSS